MSNDVSSQRLVLRLVTPLEECVSVKLGPVDAESIETLKRRDFDYATVPDVPGVISVSYLEQLLGANSPLVREDAAINRKLLPSTADLEQILDAVAADPAILAVDEGRLAGLLTLSDLNKHSLRSLLYASLANLEVELADMIRRLCPDPWEWIPQLTEDQQVQVLGYWEVTKRKNIDIGPVAACTLTQLLRLITMIEKLRREFGFKSRTSAEDVCNSLPLLRNTVMHPVRPLVGKSEDVTHLIRSIGKLSYLTGVLDRKPLPS